jgi:hypothetical protein
MAYSKGGPLERCREHLLKVPDNPTTWPSTPTVPLRPEVSRSEL